MSRSDRQKNHGEEKLAGEFRSASEIATALGVFEIAWSDLGVTAVRLEAREPGAGAAARLEAAPAFVRDLAAKLGAHAAGERVDYADVPLDLRGATPFARRVYERSRAIGLGETLTYGELARELGQAEAARAVGAALGKNPLLLVVPCHRVVGQGGALVGFSAPGGVDTKRALLALERRHAPAAPEREGARPPRRALVSDARARSC